MFNKQIHKRIKILLLLIILAFIIIISKIFYIQVIEYKKLSNLANNLWSRNLIIGANRGRILTNDNVTIASNLTTVSLVVVPNQIKNKDDIIKVVNLIDKKTKNKVELSENGIIITDKVAEILNKIEETHNCVDTDDLVGEIIDEGKFNLTGYVEDAGGELNELEIIDLWEWRINAEM